eukprot:TRINITY_DN6218_c0_g1_i1.p1 TRINITY_DN6218_c0_g1~~TRINITY_DN6218_c0_g1_i1.p1  ORF type:complete len:299 (-),score=39.08 TRINITY_DN6218_c0_g1_i1:71-967(-)
MLNSEEKSAEKHKEDQEKTLRYIVTSAVSGGSCMLLTDAVYFPLDSLKTRIQASSSSENFVKSAKSVSKFSGISTIFLSSFPAAFVFFTTYESSKLILARLPPFQSSGFIDEHVRHSASGALSELAQNLVVNPFEVMKQHMQTGLTRGFLTTAKDIYSHRGMRGFYVGYTSLILREIPFSSIQMPLYELFRKKRLAGREGELSLLENGLNGGIASAIAGFLTNPIDVIKTRMMMQRSRVYKNTLDCLNKTLRKEGFMKLLSAAHIRSFNNFLAGFVFFGLYEGLRGRLMGPSGQHHET